MSFIRLTDHAKQRALERYLFRPKQLRRMAEKAIMEGFSYNDAPTKKIARYLRKKAGENKAYAYGGYVFILSPSLVLITTFRIPHNYLP